CARAALGDAVGDAEQGVPGPQLERFPAVDVTAGVHAQLERLGVRDRERSSVCTRESDDHFSYRRDRTTGRLAGYVWLD
ncbi:laccase domain-containing protein, partial [Streptomyces griseoviridis]|uniref:laccase domain-containing protein n=1 Tax=Streptomyces griseoviridis TaxID=45398 RepID=UPI0034185608